MKARIIKRKEIAQGTLQVTFELEEEVTFRPGQYVFMSLINSPYNDEEGIRRHFSIASSPNDKKNLTIATRLRDTAFKKSLNELPIGSQVEISNITGGFVLPQDQTRPLVFIAGGIGITPFISMIKYVQEESLQHQITLVYSNRDRQSTAFLGELEAMAQKNPNIRLILTMTQDQDWTGEKRRIDAEFIKDYFPNLNNYTYFVAGPPGMVDDVFSALTQAGIKEEFIRTESFSGY